MRSPDEPVLNNDHSVSFVFTETTCVAKILEAQIDEDSSGANQRNAFDAMVAAARPVNVIDFSEVTHINYGAWGAFVSLLTRMMKRGGVIRFACLSAGVLKSFELTKTSGLFARFESPDTAITGINGIGDPQAEPSQTKAIEKLVAADLINRIPTEDFCATPHSRVLIRKEIPQGMPNIPPFDETGLLKSISQLSGVAFRLNDILPSVRKITETFLWPLSAATMLYVRQKGEPWIETNPDLPYPFDTADFQLKKKKSLASYLLKNDKDVFIADTGIHSKEVSLFLMTGEPTQDELGDFPDYMVLDENKLQLDCSLITKNPEIFHQGVILSIHSGADRVLIVLGFQDQAFGNGAYPLTKFDRPWYFILMKREILRVLRRASL